MNASNEKNKYWLKGPIKIKGVCCKQGAQRLVVTFDHVAIGPSIGRFRTLVKTVNLGTFDWLL